jgi:hypothetical protein
MSKSSKRLLVLLGIVATATVSWGCIAYVTANSVLIEKADAIIRVEVEGYAIPPANPGLRTTGVPDSKVRFKVIEVVRGLNLSDLELHGYVVQYDDFNDHAPPYTFVRSGGRAGSCYANSYRDGAQYLLFLKKENSGELTVNWAPLSPVNEQLHSQDDPWLLWVRQQVDRLQEKSRN